jgi:ATP/maltotriose-dependent transcriptional regulator MalT
MLGEGRAFLEQALSGGETTNSSMRASVLMELGHLFCIQGNLDRAQRCLQESLALARHLHFLKCIVVSLNWLGYIAMARGDYPSVQALVKESLALAPQTGNTGDIAFALNTLSAILSDQGEYEQAASLAQESLRYYQQTGNRQKIADAQWFLGLRAFYQGDLDAAVSFYEACLANYREVKDKAGTCYALRGLGFVAVFQEDYAKARTFLEESLRLRQENGDQRYGTELHALGRVACSEGSYAEAYTHYQRSLTIFQEIGNLTSIAFCLEGLAEVLLAQGHLLKAASILGCAEAVRQLSNAIRPLVAQKSYEATVTTLRLQLGEQAFQEARQQGQHIKPEALSQFLAYNDVFSISPLAQVSAPAPVTLSGPATNVPPATSEDLTRREVEIFHLLADGLTKSQIAQQLTISFHTVNAHVRSIYAKVGVSSRSAATRYALENGLA